MIFTCRCNGKSGCIFTVGQHNFPDPCPGTSKYVTVMWYCVPTGELVVFEKTCCVQTFLFSNLFFTNLVPTASCFLYFFIFDFKCEAFMRVHRKAFVREHGIFLD